MKNVVKCCLIGYGPEALPFGFNEEERCLSLKKAIKHEAERMFTEYGATYFLVKMELGIGLFAAQAILELKRDYPQIFLECVIAHEELTTKWAEPFRDRYFKILENCDKETLIQTRQTENCFLKSTSYAIERADIVVNVYDEKIGDSENIMDLSKEKGEMIVTIKP